MAKVQSRTRADGGESHRVMWVLGGGRAVPGAKRGEVGSQASETFTDKKLMLAFKAAVEAQDHEWPIGWVKGQGWVSSAPTETAPAVTFGDVHAAWLEGEREKIQLGRKKPKSVGRDNRIYELHLQPTFATMPFTAITRADVHDWVLVKDDGASPKSIHNWHGVLHSIVLFGIRELALRTDNPCSGTRLPRARYDRQIMFFQHGEAKIVRRCLRSDVHLLFDTLLATGMRWGEVSALRVGDISRVVENDDTVLRLHIVRAWSERDKAFDSSPVRDTEGETKQWRLGPPKNGRDRWVQLAGATAEQVWSSMAGKGQREYVFTTARGNPWRYNEFHSDRWAPALALAKQHGLAKEGKVNMLRHTYVVWLLAAGESIHVVSVRLGHASIQITMDRYGGLLNLNDAGSARLMAQQMVAAETAILPFELRAEDVDARPVRPGRRGEPRRRSNQPGAGAGAVSA